MNPDTVVIINLILYVLLSLFCIKKYGWLNLSAVLSYLYTITAIASFFFYNFPLYNLTYTSLGKPNIEGCLYLFILNALLILAFGKFNLSKYEKLIHYNNKFLTSLEKFLIIMYVIYLLFAFPASIMYFFSGKELGDLRAEAGLSGSQIQIPLIISIIIRTFGGMKLVLLGIVAIRFFMLKKFTNWDKIGIIVYALLELSAIFGAVSRATIVFSLMEITFILIIFKNYISKKYRRLIVKYTLIIIPLLYMTFSAITLSRFAKEDQLQLELSNLRYAGEAQLNFINLAYPELKQPFYGFGQFPLFRRILGLPYDNGKYQEEGTVYNSYIKKNFNYKYPTYIFHSLVGGLYFNWGWLGALLICFAINRFVRNKRKNNSITFMKIISIIILACYIGNGVFFMNYSNEAGNMMLLFLILMVIYLGANGYTYIFDKLKNRYVISGKEQ